MTEPLKDTAIRIISWRLFSSMFTMIIAYVLSGDLTFSGKFTIALAVIMTTVQFGFERLWQNLDKRK